MDEILMEAEEKMEGAIEHLRKEFAGMRTGRANIHLLDGIKVDYYGAETPLNQLATIGAPDPTLLTIAPFDPGSITEIEKAIQKSNLGVNPANDGKIVRLPIPPLTEERRKEMAKMCAKMGEESKTVVRNVRRDANDNAKKLEKDKEVSEDQMHDGLAEIQTLTDKFIKVVDEVVKVKKEEIMQV